MQTRIRELREAAGMSRQALAVAAGCHQGTIEAIEIRGSAPRLTTARGIADALGVSVDDLFETEEVGA